MKTIVAFKHVITPVVALVLLLISPSFISCSSNSASDDAPLVSLPSPVEFKLSLSFDGNGNAVVIAGAGAATAGNTLILESDGGTDSELVEDDGSIANPLVVPAVPGEAVSLRQEDSTGNASEALALTVPEDQVSVVELDLEDLWLDADLGVAYVLGNVKTTGAATVEIIALSTFALQDTISLTQDGNTLTGATKLACVAGSTLCVVLFEDDPVVAIVDISTGVTLDTVSATNPNAQADKVVIEDNATIITLKNQAANLQQGNDTFDLYYLTFDLTTGAITEESIFETEITNESDSTVQTTLIAHQGDNLYLITQTDSSAKFTSLTISGGLAGVPSGTTIVLDNSLSADGISAPTNTALLTSQLVDNRDLLFISQAVGDPLYQYEITPGQERTVLSTTTPGEGSGQFATLAAGDCTDTPVFSIGNAVTRVMTAYDFSENEDAINLTELGTDTIGLSADDVESTCLDGEIITGTLSKDSDDVSFFLL